MVYNKVQLLSQQNPDLAELETLLGKVLSTFNLLLRINRLESNGESALLSSINLHNIVDDVAELYLPVLEEKEQVLTTTINPKIKAFSNSDLLFQVLCNVIDNSSKFSPNKSKVAIKAIQKPSDITLHIDDQSGGVSDEELQKLCDKFYRKDTSRSEYGNGLGLSFVRAAVERMNGRLTIKNNITDGQKGLSVQITLPVNE